jgi:uncharacterized protein YqeY
MSLSNILSEDVKAALKSGDKTRVSVLRMVNAAIKNREIEKRSALTDDDISGILRSYVKRARESIDQFSIAGRTDLAEKEEQELAVIQSYLPEELSEDKTRKIISETITETEASGLKDMGKVMKAVMARTKGQVDGKLANKLVKEMLEV